LAAWATLAKASASAELDASPASRQAMLRATWSVVDSV
jgi:hypothetical protein